jgi:predicted methyltransferase
VGEYEELQKRPNLAEHVKIAESQDGQRLYNQPFLEAVHHIKDESIDAIITDPPYDESILPLCEQLAEQALWLLKPGGSLLVMVGQYRLPDVLYRMSQVIDYYWTLTYLTPGQSPHLGTRQLNTQ